jgi:pimeloyl-ACP methyl ester carboxylesterase
LLTERAAKHQHRGVRNPLLLIPGLLCDEALWAPQVAALSDIAAARVCPNGPNDSLGGLAESIIAQAPPRFALAGHSMGGRIALEVARRAPGRLLGLALLDTGFEQLAAGEAGEREAAGRHALLAMARRDGMRDMARTWLQGMVYRPRLSDHELVDGILDMFERKTPDYFELQIRALLTRPDAASVLSNLQCPTLVLCGREDAWAAPARHVIMADMVRRSTLAIIPECGHMAPLERPQAVSAALRGWLESTEGAS